MPECRILDIGCTVGGHPSLPRQVGVAIRGPYEATAMPNRGEFRATTDQMLDIIDRLQKLELEKRSVGLGSTEFVRLAVLTEEQARLTFRWSQLQHQMAVETAARVARGEQAPDIHLVDVTPRPLDKVLAGWREAQLRLEMAKPGSPEAEAATKDIEVLREEYQAIFEQVREADRGQRSGEATG